MMKRARPPFAFLLLLAVAPFFPAACKKETRTPFDFAREWAEVATAKGEEIQAQRAADLVKRWEGQTYVWAGLALAALCVDASFQCAINVFEKEKTPDYPYLGGMFPLVHFEPSEFQRLKESCKGEESCVVTFSAKLTEVHADLELPLGLTFKEGRVVGLRAPLASEKWFRDPLPKSETAGSLRTQPPQDATPFDGRTLMKRTF